MLVPKILRFQKCHKYILCEIIDGQIRPTKIKMEHTRVNCEALSDEGVEMWFNGAIYPVIESEIIGEIKISETAEKPWCGHINRNPSEQDFFHVNHIHGSLGIGQNQSS